MGQKLPETQDFSQLRDGSCQGGVCLMDALQLEIARFLAAKAAQRTRATYQQAGEAIGWNHPTGRGLGRHLEVILQYLRDQGLPPLTTILVKKGERYPAEDAMTYSRLLALEDAIDVTGRAAVRLD
jgi:hypothetical protein